MRSNCRRFMRNEPTIYPRKPRCISSFLAALLGLENAAEPWADELKEYPSWWGRSPPLPLPR